MAAPQTSVSVQQAVAFAGMVGDTAHMRDAKSYTNAEASAEIPFGLFAIQGTAVDEAKIPSAQADVGVGIVLHSHAFQKDNELGTTGLKSKVVFSALTRGRVWVTTDEAITLASAVRVRMSGAGAGTFRASSSAGVTKLLNGCRWVSVSTATPGVAQLEFDILTKNDWTND